MASHYRSLPSVEKVLQEPLIADLANAHSHAAVAELVRRELDAARERIKAGEQAPELGVLIGAVVRRAERALSPWPRRVINATGVILHTNLGRAPLSDAAVRAGAAVAAGYTDLEMDLETGRRGSRQAHVSELLAQATGAEAGLVVNNNAAAVLLGLSEFARGKEVVISRGEAVEIGGGFRIPDVLAQSGARLVEVGTTNRTYAADYESALGPASAVLLKVHQSNFAIRGFTHAADLEVLARLARARGLVLFHDLGSGALLDTSTYGLPREPMVQDSVRQGADLAFFSGDKLLGGPQAGVVVGRHELIARLARNPLARAVRVEKVTLAALSATVTAYVRGTATEELPVWRMLSTHVEDIHKRAEAWRDSLVAQESEGRQGERDFPDDRMAVSIIEVRESRSAIGGGSLPDETLPTYALAVRPTMPAEDFVARLRRWDPPVVARIEEEAVLLDPRTVLPDEDDAVVQALASALGR